MHNSKLISTLVEKDLTLSLDQCPKTNDQKRENEQIPYTSATRSSIDYMLCTPLDICFTISLINRYQSNGGLTY